MSVTNIFNAVLSRIESAVGLPDVIYPNIDGDPQGNHLRVNILPAPTIPVGIATTDRNFGIIQIDAVTKDGIGLIKAAAIADQVLALFPRNTEMVEGGDLIRINTTGSVAAPVVGGGWYALPVSIEYTLIK